MNCRQIEKPRPICGKKPNPRFGLDQRDRGKGIRARQKHGVCWLEQLSRLAVNLISTRSGAGRGDYCSIRIVNRIGFSISVFEWEPDRS